MTADEARELRHELRTPVNHLIGYAELLLEENDVSPANVSMLESIRGFARQALDLVPGLLADGAPSTQANEESVRALMNLAAQLQASTSALATGGGSLPADDLDRLTAAAERLGNLAGRLTRGPVLVDRSAGSATAPVAGRLETCLVVDDDAANRDVLGRRLRKLGYGVIEARDESKPSTAWPSLTPASTLCCST